jgi:serine/threonine-protein kinase RsbW
MKPETAEVRLTIGSRFDDLELVDTVSEAVLQHVNIDPDHLENTSLAIREGAANAIEHGNGANSGKKVEITVLMEPKLLTVRVKDEGDGFVPDDVADPLAPENLLKPRGRGIFLIRQFMDDVDFEFESGTVVVMRKELAAAQATEEAD